jgi:hypothetical protein
MNIPDEVFVVALLALAVWMWWGNRRLQMWHWALVVALVFVAGRYNVLGVGRPFYTHDWFRSLIGSNQ